MKPTGRLLAVLLALAFPAVATEYTDRTAVGSQTVGLCSGFGGWEVADDRPLDPTKGAVTRLHMYSEAPLTWRPKLRRLPDQNGTTWVELYRHPEDVSHPGNGWQSIQTVSPIYLRAGINRATALYTCGSDTPVSHVANGRADRFGEGGVLATFNAPSSSGKTPPLGVTQDTAPAMVEQHFDWPSNKDGFASAPASGGSFTVSGGIATSTGPWTADTNHDETARLILYKQGWATFAPDGSFVGVDLTGATVEMRFKMNLSLGSNTVRFWVQAAQADHTAANRHLYNMYISALDLAQYNDNQWHEISFTLPAAAGWTAAGGTCCPGGVDYSGSMDKDTALARIWNVHFMISLGASDPTGNVQFDYVRVR